MAATTQPVLWKEECLGGENTVSLHIHLHSYHPSPLIPAPRLLSLVERNLRQDAKPLNILVCILISGLTARMQIVQELFLINWLVGKYQVAFGRAQFCICRQQCELCYPCMNSWNLDVVLTVCRSGHGVAYFIISLRNLLPSLNQLMHREWERGWARFPWLRNKTTSQALLLILNTRLLLTPSTDSVGCTVEWTFLIQNKPQRIHLKM